ncbi:hypothetical protein L208DRAFT_336214 [Tricholoma matsutake]|nr:hypothetical protein L208DRAFT_336214 [Tricholoma matsutake 945]
MALPISSRNSTSNIIQDISRGETEGHVRYAASDESTSATVLRRYNFESFRNSTMRGVAFLISSRNSASNIIQDISRGETEGYIRCAPSDESPLAAPLRTSSSESFRHSTTEGMALPTSSYRSASQCFTETVHNSEVTTHRQFSHHLFFQLR